MSATVPAPPDAAGTGGRVAVLVGAVFIAGVGLAWSYLSMRSVMAVGTCADGGPYVSAQHCPPGSGYAGLAIPLLVLAAILGTFVAGSLAAPNLLVPLWLAIAAGLAGRFLANAFGGEQVDPGYLVLSVVFALLAVPALVVIVLWWRRSGRLVWVVAYPVLGLAGWLAGVVSFNAWT